MVTSITRFSNRRDRVGGLPKIFIYNLSLDSQYSLDDILRAIDDRNELVLRDGKVFTISVTCDDDDDDDFLHISFFFFFILP